VAHSSHFLNPHPGPEGVLPPPASSAERGARSAEVNFAAPMAPLQRGEGAYCPWITGDHNNARLGWKRKGPRRHCSTFPRYFRKRAVQSATVAQPTSRHGRSVVRNG
jgi:hypothetical protein